ncbi:NAD(P)-dependent oxidoreductase [Alphaproteobacteria bacterium]|nr:NAD(P)-dependent oxidoreductase [Alphaproteobacteria bacterium]
MNLDNVLITGASGLIGSPLVKKLLNKVNFIVGVDPVHKDPQQNYKHLTDINQDVSDIVKLLTKYNISKIIHVGGVSGPMLHNDKPDLIVQNNVIFTMRLIEASRIYGKIKRFIFCSSISAYGKLNEINTNEEYRMAPENLYGATKASCDMLLKMYAQNYGLDIMSLRLSTVYGYRRSTSCFINDMINSAINNRTINLPFKKDLCWPYVYVKDVVSCIEKCLIHSKKHSYDYNVSGPDFPSYQEILEQINLYVENSQATFSNKNSFDERKIFSIEKIKNEIDWEPKYSIKQGIKDYFSNII